MKAFSHYQGAKSPASRTRAGESGEISLARIGGMIIGIWLGTLVVALIKEAVKRSQYHDTVVTCIQYANGVIACGH
jgi:NhaP-type Na+/H+ or K+/H+ antiporter